MASFRSSATQAEHAIQQKMALGSARHGHQADGKIHSIRTGERYKQAAKNVSSWLKLNNQMGGLHRITPDLAHAYLNERAEQVTQKTLDTERRAIETFTDSKLERVKSLVSQSQSHRGYELGQVNLIIQRMSSRNQLAIEVAQVSGARVHELLTLQPPGARQPSTHRMWSPERFTGAAAGHLWTVQGKGGLIREVAIPDQLHQRLQQARLDEPRVIFDRNVKYTSYYDIGGGRALSQRFSELSKDELGWSDGIHSLRHVYARNRMETLQQAGMNYYAARRIVAEEMGHFRGDVTETYLR